jgi:hypothetical protein
VLVLNGFFGINAYAGSINILFATPNSPGTYSLSSEILQNIIMPPTTGATASISHTVALDGDYNLDYFENNTSKFKKSE